MQAADTITRYVSAQTAVKKAVNHDDEEARVGMAKEQKVPGHELRRPPPLCICAGSGGGGCEPRG